VAGDWGLQDVTLVNASPAELDARIRLALDKSTAASQRRLGRIRTSGLEVDEANYSIKMHGQPIDLTFKEFELLRFLAMHPARVFTREQLLAEVWGSDYFGGTRTVDVHVRRLRAKLGDLDSLIGTVRNVGYRFTVDVAAAVTTEPIVKEDKDVTLAAPDARRPV
jgi:DNA-binding response OmpR family regulator